MSCLSESNSIRRGHGLRTGVWNVTEKTRLAHDQVRMLRRRHLLIERTGKSEDPPIAGIGHPKVAHAVERYALGQRESLIVELSRVVPGIVCNSGCEIRLAEYQIGLHSGADLTIITEP